MTAMKLSRPAEAEWSQLQKAPVWVPATIHSYKNEAQRSGFIFERKMEMTDMKLSRSAEAEWSQLHLTYGDVTVSTGVRRQE